MVTGLQMNLVQWLPFEYSSALDYRNNLNIMLPLTFIPEITMEDPDNRLVPETKSGQLGKVKLHNSCKSIEAMENGVYLHHDSPICRLLSYWPFKNSLWGFCVQDRVGSLVASWIVLLSVMDPEFNRKCNPLPLTLLHHCIGWWCVPLACAS